MDPRLRGKRVSGKVCPNPVVGRSRRTVNLERGEWRHGVHSHVVGPLAGEDTMLGRLVAMLVLSAVMAATAAAQGTDLVFAVTEGVTYQATPKEIRDKFAPLAEILAKASGRRVKILVIPSYDELRAGLAKQEFDLAYVHPAHVSMAEIKAGRYKAIAWTSGFTEYTVSLMVMANAPLKGMDDLKGHTLVTPDPDSITAVMVRAMFRAEKLVASSQREPSPTTVRVITTRYQDAVPFYLENGFAEVGATAANAVVKVWTDKGGKVLFRSRPVPIKQIIVSSKIPADEQQRIRDALLTMRDSKPGRDALDVVGYKGFVAPNADFESSTIAWLGL